LNLWDLHRTFKFVNGIIWLFTGDLPGEFFYRVFVLKVNLDFFVASLHFHISFTVKILGLNVAHALRVA
jgi:hypothetical protein